MKRKERKKKKKDTPLIPIQRQILILDVSEGVKGQIAISKLNMIGSSWSLVT